jgi:hypothetical protein
VNLQGSGRGTLQCIRRQVASVVPSVERFMTARFFLPRLLREAPRWPAAALVPVAVLAMAVPSPAAADTVFGGSIGYFVPRGLDGRDTDDVIFQNLDFLLFDEQDFNGASVNGEFLIGLGDFLEAGVGAGFYQQTVPSIYSEFVDSDGTEIEQDLKLRISPVTFTARVYPISRHAPVQPYIGGGLAILAWRYSESGEFVNFNAGEEIFRATYEDSGNETAPVFFGGVRVPVGEHFLVGGEFRWHGGKATLDPSQDFAGRTLDLSGYTTSAVFQVRF